MKKTSIHRLIQEYCVSSALVPVILTISFGFLTMDDLSAQPGCEPMLSCVNDTVICTAAKAQITGDPGYTPEITENCGDDKAAVIMTGWWSLPIDKCEGDFSHGIVRSWRLTTSSGYSDCNDTTYVWRVDIRSDRLVCPTGTAMIECGDFPNAADQPSLRPPIYQIPGEEPFPLLPGDNACGVTVEISDEVWPGRCPGERVIFRTWTLHDECWQDTMCIDTLIVEDNTPPDIVFDESKLSDEMHDFMGLMGTYKTDTIRMGTDCEGHGLLPRPVVSDLCSDTSDILVSVSSVLGNFAAIKYYGGENKILSVWNIPPPKDIIAYKVVDECGNASEDTVVVVVEDMTPAVAVCHDAVNLSLTNVDHFTFLKAGSMDAESYDNCYVYEILARRTDWMEACGYEESESNSAYQFYKQYEEWVLNDPGLCQEEFQFGFAPSVPFCCEDVGKEIMVEIMVIDGNCNVDKCWGIVYVEDKLAPIVIEELPDVTISCTAYDAFYQSSVEMSDTGAIRNAFGEYVLSEFDQGQWELRDINCETAMEENTVYWDGLLSDNCGGSLFERYTFPEPGCENSVFKREFIALINGKNGMEEIVYDIQKIHIEKCPLSGMDIQLAVEDTTVYSCAIPYGLDGKIALQTPGPNLPSTLPDCAQMGVGYFDKVFDVVAGQGCQKILRTWCVVDWCDLDDSQGLNWSEIAHQEGVLTFNQYIKVVDTSAPTISVLSMVADLQTLNCSGTFSSEIDATDGCGPEPEVEWFLKDENGTKVDQGTGEVANPSASLLPGSYSLLWRATDDCNNVAEEISNFTISSEALPSVVGRSSLVSVLTPMDTNSNGIPDIAMTEIWAAEFDLSSLPPCGGNPNDLIFLLSPGHDNPGPPPDTSTSLSFTCDDYVGEPTFVPVQFWVKDMSLNTADYVNVFVVLQDHNNACGSPDPPQGGISGNILTEMNEQVAKVYVKGMSNDRETISVSGDDGKFTLSVVGDGQVLIAPEKDTDHNNGISTVDLLKIQKHILGVRLIDSPYKIIAADANLDRKLNAIDIIQFRKLLLGKVDRLPDAPSWRFVDAQHRFSKPMDALIKGFPESVPVQISERSRRSVDFVAVKLGDLDNNAIARRNVRAANELRLGIDQISFEQGEEILVPIYPLEQVQIEGLQLELQSDIQSLSISTLQSGSLLLDESMIHLSDEGSIRLSWSEAYGKLLEARVPMFYIKAIAHSSGSTRDALALSRKVLSAEMYTGDDNVGLVLEFFETTDKESGLVLHQNEPNPFIEQTFIGFYLPEDDQVIIRVVDAAGRVLLEKKEKFDRGMNRVELRKDELVPGVLYYQVESSFGSATRRMLLH